MSVPKIQHAVVVGASSGIGREIVRELARGGTKVCAVARRADRLNELAAEFPGLVLPLIHDVTDFAAVSAAFQEATRLAGGFGAL